MTLAKELHEIFNTLEYDRCGGYCYKKVVDGITYLIDNPFSGWDNEDDQESFIVDFTCFLKADDSICLSSGGKIAVELSTVFKLGDTIETINTAEHDLMTTVARITGKELVEE
jgi:hypothetical protein